MDGAQDGHEIPRTKVIELDGDADAPSRGRHAVTAVLDEWGCEPGTREDLLLVVSELVADAVVHARRADPGHDGPRRGAGPGRGDRRRGRGLAARQPPRRPPTRRPAAACPSSPGSPSPGAGGAAPGGGKTVWAELPLTMAG